MGRTPLSREFHEMEIDQVEAGARVRVVGLAPSAVVAPTEITSLARAG